MSVDGQAQGSVPANANGSGLDDTDSGCTAAARSSPGTSATTPGEDTTSATATATASQPSPAEVVSALRTCTLLSWAITLVLLAMLVSSRVEMMTPLDVARRMEDVLQAQMSARTHKTTGHRFVDRQAQLDEQTVRVGAWFLVAA